MKSKRPEEYLIIALITSAQYLVKLRFKWFKFTDDFEENFKTYLSRRPLLQHISLYEAVNCNDDTIAALKGLGKTVQWDGMVLSKRLDPGDSKYNNLVEHYAFS